MAGQVVNGRIESTALGNPGGGPFSIEVHLKLPVGHQAARFTTLGQVEALLAIAEVRTWEELKGRVLRVRGTQAKVEAIGHPLDERWVATGEA